MSVTLPDTPKPDEINAEIADLKRRLAELRALLRFSEARELAATVHAAIERTTESEVPDAE